MQNKASGVTKQASAWGKPCRWGRAHGGWGVWGMQVLSGKGAAALPICKLLNRPS